MGYTDGTWDQGTPQPDLRIFVGADQFTDFAALATLPATPAPGLLFKTVPATDAAKFFSSLPGLLLRSGVFATPAGTQEQFGTAAAQPGPSLVAGTSGPLALIQGKPPMTAAQMATIAGSRSGPQPKGIQINSVDVIYQVLALAAAAATIGLTTTQFPAISAAPIVTNLIPLGLNGLLLPIDAHPIVVNVPVPSPAMIVPTNDTEVILNINFTGGATGTVNFYGAVLNCSFNLN